MDCDCRTTAPAEIEEGRSLKEMDKRIYSHSCKLNPPCLPEPFKRWVKALKDEWEREVYDVLKDDANQSRRGGLEREGGKE